METSRTTFLSVVGKTIVVHTVTYFLLGVAAFAVFNYAALYVSPGVSGFLRPTTDPLVMAGPLFQPIRGFLLGVVLYLLRGPIFQGRRGWAVLWLTLLVLGILGPYVAAPGSLEGVIYTTVPLAFHLKSLPEVVLQTLLFSVLVIYWVNHPEKRWLTWILVVVFALVILFPALGVLVRR